MTLFKLQFEHVGPPLPKWVDSQIFFEKDCNNIYEYFNYVASVYCENDRMYKLLIFDPHHECWLTVATGSIHYLLDLYNFQIQSDFEIET